MEKLQIWHNKSCSKSNSAKNYLEENDIEFEVKNYLENPPTIDEIRELLKKLSLNVKEIIRNGEQVYLDLDLENIYDEEKLIKIVVENPILIQRPIVVGSKKAFIARPPLNMKDILNEF